MPAPLALEFETYAPTSSVNGASMNRCEVNRLLKSNQLSVGGPSSLTQSKMIFETGPRFAGTPLSIQPSLEHAMPTIYLKTNNISAAVTIALALSIATPLWAKSTAAQATQVSNGAGQVGEWQGSQAFAPDLRIAMMGMGEMGMEMGMGAMGKPKQMDKMPNKGGMDDKPMKGNMPADAPMPDNDAAMNMQEPMASQPRSDMMGSMRGSMKGGGMSNMAPIAKLPGFPGAPHLYHVGSTGFFLDHSQHITLSAGQQSALNRIKEKSSVDQTNTDRRLADLEQELWLLTAADVPDAAKIGAKIRAIESLRSDQRLTFIRAVGEAGKVLTAEQKTALQGKDPMTGQSPTAAGKTAPVPAARKAPMPATPAAMPATPAPMQME